MKTPSEYKRMAVDAMVKYVNNDEIYELAKALEEAAEQVEAAQGEKEAQHVHA